jgi:hypothetical protein
MDPRPGGQAAADRLARERLARGGVAAAPRHAELAAPQLLAQHVPEGELRRGGLRHELLPAGVARDGGRRSRRHRCRRRGGRGRGGLGAYAGRRKRSSSPPLPALPAALNACVRWLLLASPRAVGSPRASRPPSLFVDVRIIIRVCQDSDDETVWLRGSGFDSDTDEPSWASRCSNIIAQSTAQAHPHHLCSSSSFHRLEPFSSLAAPKNPSSIP